MLVGVGYISLLNRGYLCNSCFKWIAKGCIEDEESIKTALGLAGAVLVIANMRFVITRIRRTEEQIEETKNANFLNALNNGVNMLYSDNFVKQRGGVEYLHNLAEENEAEAKRNKILEIFQLYVKEIPVDTEKKQICIEGPGKYSEVVIKQEILYKITPPETCIYSEINTNINLRGAQLHGAYLPGDKVCLRGADLRRAYLQDADLRGAYLQGAYLQDTDLRRADLRRAYLQNADLRGANLQGAYLQDTDLRGAQNIWQTTWTNAQLNYALVDSKYRDELIDAKGVKDIIWMADNNTFVWRGLVCRGEEGPSQLINALKKERKEETDGKMRDVISGVIKHLT